LTYRLGPLYKPEATRKIKPNPVNAEIGPVYDT